MYPRLFTVQLLVSFIFIMYILYNVNLYDHSASKTSTKVKFKHKDHGWLSVTFLVSIRDAVTDTLSIVLSVVRITSSLYHPYVQRLIKAICFIQHNIVLQKVNEMKYRGSCLFLLSSLFLSHCAPTSLDIPGTS